MVLRTHRRRAIGVPQMDKILVALDFDHTLIDDNSDTYILKLAPESQLLDEIRKRYSPGSWTALMRAVFKYLYECGVRPDELLECLREIPMIAGIKDLFQALNESGICEVIIISDANTVFIEHLLHCNGVRHLVHEVFSNYAQFDGNGCLQIHEYHNNDWCTSCPVNLCKSKVVNDYISRRRKQGVNLHKVIYVGDGKNDFCPAMKCKRSDLVLARQNFALAKKLQERSINAKVHYWNDGFDILKVAETHLSDGSSSGTASPNSDH